VRVDATCVRLLDATCVRLLLNAQYPPIAFECTMNALYSQCLVELILQNICHLKFVVIAAVHRLRQRLIVCVALLSFLGSFERM